MPAPEPTDKKAIVVGATGAVGKQLVQELLKSPAYSEVHSFGRRPTGIKHDKLRDHIVDFEQLCLKMDVQRPEFTAVAADAVFITLGTTKAQAGSMANFERIDREYVIAAATAAFVQGKKQELHYVSSTSADSRSFIPYSKSKGHTEQALGVLPYRSVFLYRPGLLLNPQRSDKRIFESAAQVVVGSVLSKVSNSAGIDVNDVAKAMVKCSIMGAEKLASKGIGSLPKGKPWKELGPNLSVVTVVSNAEQLALAAAA